MQHFQVGNNLVGHFTLVEHRKGGATTGLEFSDNVDSATGVSR